MQPHVFLFIFWRVQKSYLKQENVAFLLLPSPYRCLVVASQYYSFFLTVPRPGATFGGALSLERQAGLHALLLSSRGECPLELGEQGGREGGSSGDDRGSDRQIWQMPRNRCTRPVRRPRPYAPPRADPRSENKAISRFTLADTFGPSEPVVATRLLKHSPARRRRRRLALRNPSCIARFVVLKKAEGNGNFGPAF